MPATWKQLFYQFAAGAWLCLGCAMTKEIAPPKETSATSTFQEEVEKLRKALGEAPSTEDRVNPESVIIGISKARNLTYVPSELLVKAGAKVRWVSVDGEFTLWMVGVSPFDFVAIKSHADPNDPTKRKQIAEARISDTTRKGRYRYAVMLERPGESMYYLDPTCPPIIVDTKAQ